MNTSIIVESSYFIKISNFLKQCLDGRGCPYTDFISHPSWCWHHHLVSGEVYITLEWSKIVRPKKQPNHLASKETQVTLFVVVVVAAVVTFIHVPTNLPCLCFRTSSDPAPGLSTQLSEGIWWDPWSQIYVVYRCFQLHMSMLGAYPTMDLIWFGVGENPNKPVDMCS